MSSSTHHSNENIVKKLFLPSYTNSGSSVAYHAHGHDNSGNNNSDDDMHPSANDNDAAVINNYTNGDDDGTSQKQQPRDFGLSVSNAPFQYGCDGYGDQNQNHHVEEYDGSQIGGYAPQPSSSSDPTPQSVISIAASSISNASQKIGLDDNVDGESKGEHGLVKNDDKNGLPEHRPLEVDLDFNMHTNADADADKYTDTKSVSMSTAVNTGSAMKITNHNDDGDGDDADDGGDRKKKRVQTMVVPQTPKNDHLLSPPSVMRKITEMESPALKPATLFRRDRDSRDRENHHHPYHVKKEEGNDTIRNDDDDETGSMVSQYGSDVGEVKLRLEDVRGMEAVAEDEEQEEECSEGEGECEGGDVNSQQEAEAEKENGTELESNFLDVDPMNANGLSNNHLGTSFDHDHDQRQTQTSQGSDGNDHGQNYDIQYDYDDMSQGYEASVTSVDLASQHESSSSVAPDNIYEYTHFQDHIQSSPKKTSSSTAHHKDSRGHIPSLPDFSCTPRSNANKKDSIPPSSPMGAVSAALRRFGNGFGSNMTRCTQPSMPTMDQSPPASGPDAAVGDIWLSPRLRREPSVHNNNNNYVAKRSSPFSIHQPIFGEPQSNLNSNLNSRRSHTNIPLRRSRKTGTERAAAASQMLGITNCLSFDPESGRKPYGNMRVTDSPPLLPSRRKTRSWGSVHSGDFFPVVDGNGASGNGNGNGNGKDIFGNRNGHSQTQRIELAVPQSPVAADPNNQGKVTPPQGAFHSEGVVGRMMDGILSPKGKEKLGHMLSPRRKNSVVDTPPRSTARGMDRSFTPSGGNRSIVVLRSPQRVDNVEHEDALDLLALLVERSVSFQGTSDLAKSEGIEECVEILRKISRQYEGNDNGDISHEARMEVLNSLESAHTYAMEMKQAALSASTWLHAIGRSGESASSKTRRDFNSRNNSRVILSSEEMMKMGTKELVSIVQSIELQLADKNELNIRLDNELSKCRAEIGRLKTTSRTENSFLAPDKSILDDEAGDDSTATTSVGGNEFPDSSDINIDVTDAIATKIDEESKNATCLADAKKEILLLKAELEEANKMLRNMERAIKWPNSKENNVKEEGTQISGDADKNDSEDEDRASNSEEAEETKEEGEIASNCGDDDNLPSDPTKSPKTEEESTQNNAPSLLKNALQEELDEYVAAVQEVDRDKIRLLKEKVELMEKNKLEESDPDKKMIHVRMLDAENFVTDWDSLGPLPPPPDHDLRSPIVHDLLSQWTNDSKTQDSLLQWVENIMNGGEPSSVPPLQLSGLDHRVRDGFTMHILPFLLRRSDIHVEVTTRAHRQTSYDVSVTVRGSKATSDGSISFGSQSQSDGSKHPHMSLAATMPHMNMMAFKASTAGGSLENSIEATPVLTERGLFKGYFSEEKGSPTHSAVTAPISNHAVSSSQLSRLTRAGGSHSSDADLYNLQTLSEDMKRRQSQSQQQSGGIVAGAWKSMGDLLSRRKTPNNEDHASTSQKERSYISPQSPVLEDIAELSEAEEENQPYHRVVSAPPGKIGITFVQYRGHAMVSDVYNDSPLSGWVFPSDILIAVDEVPVSGMRVPEIVELLTVRKERQRALRVISSHAMTELLITEDSGALMDG